MADASCTSDPVDQEQGCGQSQKQKKRLMYLAEQAGVPYDEAVAKKMSQRQLKKLVSKQKFELIKKSKRKEEKEKRKLFKKQKLADNTFVQKPKKTPVLMRDSDNKVSVVIDLNFSDLMSDMDSKKLRKQINRCYSMNRSAKSPVQFYLTSCSQKLKDELSGSNSGFQNWDIHVSDKDYMQLFGGEEGRKSLIYLTRDSDNVLPDSSEIRTKPKVYVIGGLVDHNVHKGLTLERAKNEGISHARLPIDEHLRMSRTQVLTVNHVFELLLMVSQGTEWPESLNTVIPQRKMHPECKAKKTDSLTDPKAAAEENEKPDEAKSSSDS